MTSNYKIRGFSMGNTLSLQDIMRDVSARLDGAMAVAPVFSAGDELQAFMAQDPLLASLHKQYLDAKDMRRKSEKDYGKDDPMTEMALLVEDSAWCAMQTRYMELRDDRILMAKAQETMEEERIMANLKREEENKREALQNYYRMEMLTRARQKSEATAGFLWMALFYLFMCNSGSFFRQYQPTHQFNRLAA